MMMNGEVQRPTEITDYLVANKWTPHFYYSVYPANELQFYFLFVAQ